MWSFKYFYEIKNFTTRLGGGVKGRRHCALHVRPDQVRAIYWFCHCASLLILVRGAGALEWLAEVLRLIQSHPANFTINWQSLFVALMGVVLLRDALQNVFHIKEHFLGI